MSARNTLCSCHKFMGKSSPRLLTVFLFIFLYTLSKVCLCNLAFSAADNEPTFLSISYIILYFYPTKHLYFVFYRHQ